MKFEKNPNGSYRAVPFWSLNGKLNKNELLSQIKTLKNMGFGGVFIHSRTGLKTEYMGKEWLGLTADCADECKRENMDAWLYDEDRWPSGTCGGYVTEDPNYRMRFISARIMPRDEFDLHDCAADYIASFAVKLTGKEYELYSEYNMPEYSGMSIADYFPVHNKCEIPEGYLGMIFGIELMKPNEFYNDFTYADTMNTSATDRFIELTHEKYAKACGEKFGDSIKGIFTDEPHRGPLLNGFGITNENALYMLPYTGELFSLYRKLFGEDLSALLPELYFNTEGNEFSRTMWRYVETLQRLFINNFAKPVHEWCEKNNLLVTGHILHEDTLSAQTTMSGSIMRYYEHMDYPGLDNLGSQNTCFPAVIAVNSVAKQTGKKRVLSELYGCTGWKTTFDEYKQMGDWQAAFGVNVRCPHLSWYTMKGEAKRDYPASINKQANWHKEYRAVEDYFARLGYALGNANSVTETLVITPVESAWGMSHLGTYVNSFGVRDKKYAALEEDFFNITNALVYGNIDFDYGDEEMMSRLCKTGKDDRGAYVKLGKMTYRSVVLPAMVNIRKSTVNILNEFTALGGKVIAAKHMPEYLDGERATVKLSSTVADISSLVSELKSARTAYVQSDGKFYSAIKAKGGEYLYFAVNGDARKGADAKIIVRGEFNAEKFDLRTGETVGIRFTHSGGNTVVEHCFAAGEELLLHFTHKKVAPCKTSEYGNEFVLDKPSGYKLSRPNALVLDRAAAYVNGEYFDTDELLRLDRKLRDKFGLRYRGGSMVQPWYKEKFGGDEYSRTVCELKLEFTFNADYAPENAKLMAEDYGSIAFALNGVKIDGRGEQSETDECFTVASIPAGAIKRGENKLTAEFDFSDSADIENIYILGDFGVIAGNPCTVTKLPDSLGLSDVTLQGLPFYAGTVTYEFDCADGEYEVSVPEYYAACLKFGDTVCAFSPATHTASAENGKLCVSAVLTPKNMFGPLHELPAYNGICGPENFHTGLHQWTDDYALIPQGILGGIKVRKILSK